MVAVKWHQRKARPPPKDVRKVPTSHPSKGGSRGYSMDMRELSLRIKLSGLEESLVIQQQRNAKKFPSRWTTKRLYDRLTQEGHIKPYTQNGNRPSKVLQGRMRFLLVLYRTLFPKCTAAELNTYLYNVTPPGTEKRFYSNSQITRAEDDIGLVRKRGATTARQANLPHNLAKMHQYLTLPYPFGIADLNRSQAIDFDECAIHVEIVNRGYGKVFIGKDLNEQGPYNHSVKFTLTMGVSGNQQGNRWFRCEKKAGTTTHNTFDFLQHMIADLGGNNRHTFLCDNLSAHRHNTVRQLVYTSGHRMIYRPPYRPRLGPIEYVFNRLQHELTIRMHEVNNERDLKVAVEDIVRGMGNFEEYFRHCGI